MRLSLLKCPFQLRDPFGELGILFVTCTAQFLSLFQAFCQRGFAGLQFGLKLVEQLLLLVKLLLLCCDLLTMSLKLSA